MVKLLVLKHLKQTRISNEDNQRLLKKISQNGQTEAGYIRHLIKKDLKKE